LYEGPAKSVKSLIASTGAPRLTMSIAIRYDLFFAAAPSKGSAEPGRRNS